MLTGIVVTDSGVELIAEQVITHCREYLVGCECPKRVDFVAEPSKHLALPRRREW